MQAGDHKCPGCGQWYWQDTAGEHAKCLPAVLRPVTPAVPVITCKSCDTKQEVIESLRRQISEFQERDRGVRKRGAEYMRRYRANRP